MASLRDLILEVITEEQLDEKLITYGNRKPYGQVVFLAGGAGSGKGFAISNFLDSAGFKVRDVDEMKKQLQVLNRLGRTSIDDIIRKYGKNIPPKEIENIRSIQSQGYKLQDMNLKRPEQVQALHALVKAMGIKDVSLSNMLAAASNPEVLPNIMFDITAKDLSDITDVLPQLKEAGYKPENIHLTWILTNYVVAMENNKGRSRMVPEDILLKTHEGASNTIWGLVTKALPKGMNGRVDVVLNNPENTVYIKNAAGQDIEKTQDKVKTHMSLDDKGKIKTTRTVEKEKVKFATNFLSLPLKSAGSGFVPEKIWRNILFGWIKQNAPDSVTSNME